MSAHVHTLFTEWCSEFLSLVFSSAWNQFREFCAREPAQLHVSDSRYTLSYAYRVGVAFGFFERLSPQAASECPRGCGCVASVALATLQVAQC
eukprot:1812655-Alexandrium_andersonii.AAC.1